MSLRKVLTSMLSYSCAVAWQSTPLRVVRLGSLEDGNQEIWLAAFRERIVRVVHWHRTSRSAVSCTRSGAGERCQRNLRAGRSDRMAYASARADVNRNG